MDYNLVLKFKKYPDEKPNTDNNELAQLLVIVKNDNNNEYYCFNTMYNRQEEKFVVEEHETVLAFAELPSSNKFIELLNSNKETILVTKQYLERLEYSDNLLSALQEAGVDNWYDEAICILNSSKGCD